MVSKCPWAVVITLSVQSSMFGNNDLKIQGAMVELYTHQNQVIPTLVWTHLTVLCIFMPLGLHLRHGPKPIVLVHLQIRLPFRLSIKLWQ